MSDAAQATAKMNPNEGSDKRFVSRAEGTSDGPNVAANADTAKG
jgi:hypothetical protein